MMQTALSAVFLSHLMVAANGRLRFVVTEADCLLSVARVYERCRLDSGYFLWHN
jgi:hypothetical protein